MLYGDVVRVIADGTTQIEAFVVQAGETSETVVEVLNCPLGGSVLFHSVKRTRLDTNITFSFLSESEKYE